MIVVVLAVWIVGTCDEVLARDGCVHPIAIAPGALAGVILLWVKIVRESLRRRGTSERDRLTCRPDPTRPRGT